MGTPNARALIAHYLDPARRWDAASEATLRELLREDEAARGAYRQAVMMHRAMLGGDPGTPSGFEQRRMMEAVVEARATDARPARRSVMVWLAPLVACAAAAALLLTVPGGGPTADPTVDPGAGPSLNDPTLRARGNNDDRGPLVGLGISGVTEGGVEYEVVASEGVSIADYFRFSYSNERPELGHLFIFGLQAAHDGPLWYAPLPPEETTSLPVGTGRTIQLPFENKVAARHVTGKVRVVAIFTQQPLLVGDVQSGLQGAALYGADRDAVSELVKGQLGLPDSTVVRVVEVNVRPAGRGGGIE